MKRLKPRLEDDKYPRELKHLAYGLERQGLKLASGIVTRGRAEVEGRRIGLAGRQLREPRFPICGLSSGLLMRLRTLSGRPYPIGASVHPQGVNFSVFSKSSTSVELMFFDGVDDARPGVVVPLDPTDNRTYHYWHVFVHGIVNAYWEPLTFELPPPAGVHQGWHRGIDTSLDPPEDICDGPDAAPFVDKTYRVESRSIVLLFSVRANGTGQSQPLAASHTIQN